MTESRPSPEGAYDVVTMGGSWGSLSLLFALLALFSRRWIALLPWHLQGYYLIPPLAVLVVPPLAALGLLTGWLALRRDRRSTAGRLGLLANGVILLVSTLLVLSVWWLRRSFV